MISVLDSSFAYSCTGDAEAHDTFARVWRELGERDACDDADDEMDRNSVWLECNAELVATGSVKSLGVRRSALGVEMLQFMCPRCGERHESLRFG